LNAAGWVVFQKGKVCNWVKIK